MFREISNTKNETHLTLLNEETIENKATFQFTYSSLECPDFFRELSGKKILILVKLGEKYGNTLYSVNGQQWFNNPNLAMDSFLKIKDYYLNKFNKKSS
jgi:hypothetical protein